MSWVRIQAAAPVAAFAVLAGALVAVGAIEALEATWIVASVTAGFLPSGWFAPGGWRRRAAEAALLPSGYALTMLADPDMRRMAMPVLLTLAAAAATWAATTRVPSERHPSLAAAFGLAAWAASGLALTGLPLLRVGVSGLTYAAVGWGIGRAGGVAAGLVAVLATGSLALPQHPWLAVSLALASLLAGRRQRHNNTAERIARGWLPAALAGGLLAAALGPWGGLPLGRALPRAGWPAMVAVTAVATLAPLLPPAAAGASWLAATLALGEATPAPPDRPSFTLDAAHPQARLPETTAARYVIELAMANGAGLPQDAAVATVSGGGRSLVLRAGEHAAEWAWLRGDVRRNVAHSLPRDPVWSPHGIGATALWGVAGQAVVAAPGGITPLLERDPALPPGVTVTVTAGPARPTPPRDWPLPRWLFATALVVGLVQLAAGTWRQRWAAAPWTLLTLGSLAARMPIEPLRLLAERHAADIAFAALLAAWWPAARAWLGARRVFLTAAALFLPLALATPHLTPPLWGDEPYHLVMLDSLARFGTLDLPAHYPLPKPGSPLHSPVLAFLLLPAYLIGGRGGALAALSLGAAAMVALVVRRARQLGLRERRGRTLVVLLVATYPLATFATQIWVEVVGALIVAASLLLVDGTRRARVGVAGLAALATAVKARLGLLAFPLAVVAWWPARSLWRRRFVAARVLAAVAGVGLGITWILYGRPLGDRGLSDLIPMSVRQPFVVLGGLAFDDAGGLLFTGPLLVAALAGVAALWRRGGRGERALLVGGMATVVALLHSPEWYGGGSPPGRYLVPLLPAFALAGASVLAEPRRWRGAAALLVPPGLFAWWTLLSRPQFSINSGDGGWWFADTLAARFGAGARQLFPSFLRPSSATVLVPVALVALVAIIALAARRRAGFARGAARLAAVWWLLALAFLAVVATQRFDAMVEIEDPQVTRLGGTIEPPEGTFSRYTYPNGWRVADGEGVEVPLHLPSGARLFLDGWLDGPARRGATLRVRWDGGAAREIEVASEVPGRIPLPPPPGEGGRHRLRLMLASPAGGSAVLDRVVVER